MGRLRDDREREWAAMASGTEAAAALRRWPAGSSARPSTMGPYVWEMLEPPAADSQSDEDEPKLLKERLSVSLAEAAQLLGVTERHVRNLANRGVIDTVRLGARRVIAVSTLRRLLGEPE